MPRVYPSPIPCSVEGCPRSVHAREWCKKHYEQWRVYGSPIPQHQYAAKGSGHRWLVEVVSNRDRSEGCWEWPYCVDGSGYGLLHYLGKKMKAPQVALILDGRERPEWPRNCTLHSCDNRLCCNPAHLRWGSNAENVADAMARSRHSFGLRNGRSKLTPEMVRRIRSGEKSCREFAEELGINRRTIQRAKTGKNWKQVE